MTENKKTHYKERLAKKPTKWLRDLPEGEYSIKQLIEITNRKYSGIKQRLNLLEIPKSYIIPEEYNSRGGFPIVKYKWIGIVEYERQNSIEKQEDEKTCS
jgi:hypothetical protein